MQVWGSGRGSGWSLDKEGSIKVAYRNERWLRRLGVDYSAFLSFQGSPRMPPQPVLLFIDPALTSGSLCSHDAQWNHPQDLSHLSPHPKSSWPSSNTLFIHIHVIIYFRNVLLSFSPVALTREWTDPLLEVPGYMKGHLVVTVTGQGTGALKVLHRRNCPPRIQEHFAEIVIPQPPAAG